MKRRIASRERPPAPLYGFSLTGAFFLVLSVIFGIATVGTLFLFPETEIARFAGGALLALLTLFNLLAFLRLFLMPVRSAAFHSDHFAVSKGRNLRTFGYTQIEAVSTKRLPIGRWFPYPFLREQVQIHIRGLSEPVVIPINLRSRSLPTDLYS